jgi:hypothetical protein
VAGDQRGWPVEESDGRGWPDASDCNDEEGKFSRALCEAKLEVRKKRVDEVIELSKAANEADLAIEQAYYGAVFDVAKGSIGRARASAATVQKAATAVITLYTGILALAFSVTEHPLPLRALFAALLLGLAIIFSTVFLAYLPSDPPSGAQRNHGDGPTGTGPAAFANSFIAWTRTAALERGVWLRRSVVALAAAVFFLPAPFVELSVEQQGVPPTDWPKLDSVVSGEDVELQKILYSAQVSEIAAERKEPIAQTSYDWVWWIPFGVALLLIWILPKFFGGPQKWTVAGVEAATVLVALGLALAAGVAGYLIGHAM